MSANAHDPKHTDQSTRTKTHNHARPRASVVGLRCRRTRLRGTRRFSSLQRRLRLPAESELSVARTPARRSRRHPKLGQPCTRRRRPLESATRHRAHHGRPVARMRPRRPHRQRPNRTVLPRENMQSIPCIEGCDILDTPPTTFGRTDTSGGARLNATAPECAEASATARLQTTNDLGNRTPCAVHRDGEDIAPTPRGQTFARTRGKPSLARPATEAERPCGNRRFSDSEA